MSAPIDPAWPQIGSEWTTVDDALLACQLAGLKVGLPPFEVRRDKSRPHVCSLRCTGTKKGPPCRDTAVTLQQVNKEKPKFGWLVKKVQAEHLQVAHYPVQPSNAQPSELPRTLQIGDVLQATQLSMVEGSLRSASRKKGRYLSSLYRKGAGQMQRFISSAHTCARAIAEKPGDELLARMAFFPAITLTDGVLGAPQRIYRQVTSANDMSSVDAEDSVDVWASAPAPPPPDKKRTWTHNGKQETNHERKQRKRLKRELKTGKEESKSERAERRRLHKGKKAARARKAEKEAVKAQEKREKKARKEAKRKRKELRRLKKQARE